MEKDKKESWTSGIKILKKMQVVVPLKLQLVCDQLADKVRGDEFSIVTNVIEKDDTELLLSEEFYIPKQEVNSSYINYLPDDYQNNKYNCVIHRHPDGCNGFSSTDMEFINQNFELSLLYTKRDGFVAGLYNLRHENGYLIQLPVEIYVDYGLEEIDITNITKPAPLVVIDKPKRHKSKESKLRNDLRDLRIDSNWDLNEPHTSRELFPDRRDRVDKLLPEEKMDYTLMKEFLMEELDGELKDINYRLENMEEYVFHNTGFSANAGDGMPF